MIVLDTNVISELAKSAPDQRVTQWADAQYPDQIGTTTVVLAELEFGLALMPVGERRRSLTEKIETLVREIFADRIYAFDQLAVPHFARMGALQKSNGRSIEAADLMIAAIAASRGFSVCTRNIADFEFCGVPLLNPWQA